MDVWEANKLLLFIAFAIPGFISLKSYEILCPSSGKSSYDRLIDERNRGQVLQSSMFAKAMSMGPSQVLQRCNARER